jgi:hypothetical protein
VEIDRSDISALALVSSGSIATCLTTRSGGNFGTTSLGVGGYPTTSPVALSYLTSQRAGDQFILVGRIPSGAHGVRVTFDDATNEEASIGNGLWLAWVSDAGNPTMIEAVDESGTIDRLNDPNGIQPHD